MTYTTTVYVWPFCLDYVIFIVFPIYQLTVQYLIGSGVTHAAWNILGIGIRIALERGLHKSRRGKQKPTVEDELYKRAFWFVVYVIIFPTI
jgi:hypothetical protein